MQRLFRYPMKLFTLLTVCILGFHVFFLLLSGAMIYFTYSEMAYREIRKTKIELLEQNSQKLSSYVSSIQDTALFLVTGELTRDWLSAPPTGFYDYYSKSEDIYDEFQKLLSVKSGVHSIELYSDWSRGYPAIQDRFLYTLADAEAEGWLARMEHADGFWLPAHPYEGLAGANVVSYVHRMINQRGHTVGFVKINVKERQLFDMLSGGSAESGTDAGANYYTIKDSGGSEIASTAPESDSGYSAIYTDSNSEYWQLVQLIPKDAFHENRRETLLLTLGLVGALIVISIPLALWISRKLTRPIRSIVEGMHEVEKGNFDVRLDQVSVQEYLYLTTHFNRMVHRLKELVWRLDREHRDRREAEMHLLQAQIKPHFLYNTLDLIHWRALDYQAHDISQMVHQLSKLFRIGLSNNKWYVAVRDELAHARCYIAIQQYRHPFTVTYEEDIDPGAQSALIPKIMLQPFLENAFIHGFRNRPEQGVIRVSMERKQENGMDQLWIVVTDNGSGLPEHYDLKSSKGIGIGNVIDRIQLYCGVQYGVSMSRGEAGGTVVTIRLPYIQNEEEIDQLTRSLSS